MGVDYVAMLSAAVDLGLIADYDVIYPPNSDDRGAVVGIVSEQGEISMFFGPELESELFDIWADKLGKDINEL